MSMLAALVSGLVFGLGLVVSDMIDPSRVLGFLDIASGAWDPTLAFVMAGAIPPMAVAWRIAKSRKASLLGTPLPGRPSGGPDRRLLAGAAIFGLGWGLSGFCPGPAIAALGVGGWPTWLFGAALFAGFAAVHLAGKQRGNV